MMRNIEKILHAALGNPQEVQGFLQALVEGRYDSADGQAA
jgi:hypothetical protein